MMVRKINRAITRIGFFVLSWFYGMVTDYNTASGDQLFVGTQGVPTIFGAQGHVYQYLSDTTWRDLNPTKNIGQAIMRLVFFRDTLYVATQTHSGYGGCDFGGCGRGQVWKYHGRPNFWTQVGGNLDNSVMVLLVYNSTLYAGTSLVEKSPNVGNLYKLVAGNWILVGTGGSTGWRAGIVTDLFPPLTPIPQIYLGELNVDAFARYTDGSGLVPLQNLGGSCVWGFREYQGALYSGHWHGPVYKTTDGISWTLAHQTDQDHNWGMEVFQGKLYLGTGSGDGLSPGRLFTFDGTKWEEVHSWPAKVNGEGVTSLATDTDQTRLYIGLGVPDGYYTGDGVAEVWQYDGIHFTRISRPDHFGGGVQSLLTHFTGCTTFDDLDQTISDAVIDNEGIRNSLLSKARNARKQYDRGNLRASGNILCALLHEVDAQDGKHIELMLS